MFLKKDNNDELDKKNLNDVIFLSKKILKIMYGLFLVTAIYVVIILFKELKFASILGTILGILSPLFIGLMIAWIFDPSVKKLKEKGIKRSIGTTLIYLLLIGILSLIIGSIIPILIEQINDFASSLPTIFDSIKVWIDNVFNAIANENIDIVNIKNEIFSKIEDMTVNMTSSIPEILVNGVKVFFSGIGTFVVGLIIGFFLLISFDNAGDLLITLLPRKIQLDARNLLGEVNTSLRRFLKGAFYDCTLIFVVTSLGFLLVGLKAPILFGLFCGITNIIPYAGPYIGGIPAVVVGFSQSTLTGILTLITIFVVQFLEGNFLQPVIMSKTTKLHPVTIILGLLLFGHFFGIFGMLFSTPIIAAIKTIFTFFVDKFDLFNYNK